MKFWLGIILTFGLVNGAHAKPGSAAPSGCYRFLGTLFDRFRGENTQEFNRYLFPQQWVSDSSPFRANHLWSNPRGPHETRDFGDSIFGLRTLISHESTLPTKAIHRHLLAEVYWDGTRRLQLDETGLGIQIDRKGVSETFMIVDGKRLAHPQLYPDIPVVASIPVLNIFNAVLQRPSRQSLLHRYFQKYPVGTTSRTPFHEIIEDIESRSILIGKMQQPLMAIQPEKYFFYHYQPHGIKPLTEHDQILARRKLGEKEFSFHGSAIVVSSKAVTEPLPMEYFRNFFVSRKPGETIVEIEHFVAKENDRRTLDEVLQLTATLIAGNKDVDRIFIEVDSRSKRLFEKIGFKKIHQFQDIEKKSSTFVMETTPQDFLRQSMKKLKGFEL